MSSYLENEAAGCSTITDVLALRAQSDSTDAGYTFLADGETESGHYAFHDLDKRAKSIGAFLQDREARGKPVLLLYPSGLEFIAAFFGCLYSGAIAVPAYPPRANRHSARIQAIIQDAGAWRCEKLYFYI